MSNNNKMPEGWGQNKSVPDSWKKENDLPENWCKQSSGTKVSSDNSSASENNSAPESNISVSEIAHAGAGLLAGAAKKIGGAAKNAAENAVEYAKSDDAREKLDAAKVKIDTAKDKAQALVDSAGAAMSDMKDKAASIIADHKKDGEDITESEFQEVSFDATVHEEHNSDVDEMIENALAASGEDSEDADYDAVPEEQSVVDNTPVNAISEPVVGQSPVQNERYYEQPVNQSPVQNQGYYVPPENDQMQLYGYKEKKSPLVYVMAGIIAVLLVGGGILGGMLMMKNKDDKSDRIAASVPETQDQTVDETVAYENTTPSETGNTTTSAIETNVTTVDATKNATNNNETQATPVVTGNKLKFYSSDKINDYPAYLEKLRDIQNNGTYRDQNNGFFLCDINEDDTPELFVTFNTEETDLLFAGSVYSGELVPFAEFMGAGMLRGITLFDNGAIGITSGGNEGHGISYKYYNGGNSFSDQNNNDESISYIYENGSLSYISYQNGGQEKHISEAEADEIQQKYIEASYTAEPVSSLIRTEPEKPSSLYSDSELGFMYNQYYIRTYTWGEIGGGYILDYDGDGTDEIVCSTANGGLQVLKYQNGELEWAGQASQNISSQYYDNQQLPAKCLELAAEHGYGVNSDFVSNSEPGIGYVATSDMFGTLNLRSAPSTDSEVITQLPNGLLFNTSDNPYNKPAFFYITTTYKGQTYSGYVSSDYVSISEKGL